MSWGDAAGQGIGAGGELTLAEETFVQGLAGIAFQTGDLIYYNGTALTRLGIGSASQVLTVSSGLPAWAAASAGGGASDHGDLTGLADDDHTQYALNTHSYVTVAAEARFTAERVLTGTANQITITDGGAGTTVTLATPQDIHTAASPQFTALNIGHATDTTLARSGAGDLTIEGNAVYRVGGTDVAVADGGTGASTAAGARSNLAAAPNTATYVTISTDAELTVERTLAGGAGLTLTDGGAGAAVTLAVGAGSGITVNADDVAVNQGFAFAWTAAHTHTVAGLVKTNTNTTDGASVQVAIFEGDRATMADADEAYLTLRLSNDGGTQTEFARLTWVATDVNAATSVDGRLDFAVVTAGTLADELQLDGTALSPSTTDGLALGTSLLNFADLFLDLGAVINFDSGDVTITHSANALDIDGGVVDFGSGPTVNAAVIYFAGGTDVALADGGTGASLVDPNDDRIFMWDDSAGATALTDLGTGLTTNATPQILVDQATAFAWTAAHTHTVAGLVKTLTNTTDSTSMQVAILESDSATPAANDEAYLSLRLSDSVGNQDEFARLTWVGTDATSTSEDGRLDFAVVTAGTLADELQLDGTALSPSTTDGLALGTSALNFADLFLDLAAVINFDSGDVTLTHAANRLTIAGGEFDLGGATDNILVAGADPKKSFFIHAAGMWPSTTSGSAALAKVELATNKVNYQSLDFDQTAQEFAEFALQMPDNWDASTLTFRVAWTASAGTGAVVWELQATALANDDAIDTAWGTAVEVTDTLIATSDMHDTGESGAVTVGNTPAAGEWVQFRIARDPANASDTLTADARLTGVRVEYGIGQYNQ